MSVRATRAEALLARFAFAAFGAATIGICEGVRVVLGTRLLWTEARLGVLLLTSLVASAAFGALGAIPLAILPMRPLGRERWGAFLYGVALWGAAAVGIVWFTDPPPFTDPFPGQGNPLYFAGILLGIGAVALGLYQGVRGATRVATAATVLAAGGGVWAYLATDSVSAPSQPLPPGAPNVLFVTLDTTRADHLGAYGNTEADTRAFDAVAKDGALFTSASAVAAVTGPSHTSMLMGAGPWDHQVLLNGIPLPEDRPLVSEVMRAHGYDTAAFVSAYVLDGKLGFRRGFGVYDDDFGWLKGGSLLMPARLVAMARRASDPDEVLERRGGDTVDEALSWLNQPRSQPYFLWVHLFDAHGPYAPPPPWDTRYYQGDPKDPAHTSMKDLTGIAAYLKASLLGITDVSYVLAQYQGEVSYADTQLGRLLDAVGKDTVVVVMGDHGESLGEHGVWFNHGDDVYETSVHVPFAVRWAGHVPAGTRVETPVEGSDLAPTVLGLVGIEPPPTMTGKPAITPAGTPGDRSLAHAMCYDREANQTERAAGRITKPKYRMVGLRGPSLRYIERELDGKKELFELLADPSGLRDVYESTAASPDGPNLLAGYGEQAATLFGHSTDRSAADISDDARKALEALGYLEQ